MVSRQGRTVRRAAVLAAALTVAGLAAVAPTATAVEGFELERVAGENRYATAAALAAEAFPEGSSVAVLASGENFPDALAGSFLAGRFGGGAPILLTTRASLPSETSEALDSLGVETVYILGGTGAVSAEVEAALGERTVVRIAGDNRYATAAQIATFEAEGAAAPEPVGGQATVILASGEGFADALAAGPLAFQGRLPVLLTPADALDDDAAAAIESLGAARVWVVGGTAAVGTAVEDELEELGLTVVRIAGANRYATATAAAARGRADLGLTSTAVDLASGENFPDALAAGPASGAANRPLILTARALLSEETETYLTTNSSTLTQGRVFGGTAAVSNLAVAQANAAGSSGEAVRLKRVVGHRAADREYDYVEDGSDEVVTVTYNDADEFTVDGQEAAASGFASQITNGDVIEIDDPEDPTEHDLTNVSAASFTTGVVGNVDLADDQLDIVEPVSGSAFRANITYAGTLRVDGEKVEIAEFEADVNEGDTIEIAGGAFNLTNTVTEGVVEELQIVESQVPAPVGGNTTRFKIGGLGDDPAASSDPDQIPDEEGAGNDDKYEVTGDDEQLIVDGAEVTYDQFEAAINNGDQIRYVRTGGIERFAIVNENELVEGEVGTADDISGDGTDLDTTEDSDDGGSFTMVTEDDETQTVEYGPNTELLVDGQVVDEEDFEDDISTGDDVVVERDGNTVVSISLEDDDA